MLKMILFSGTAEASRSTELSGRREGQTGALGGGSGDVES